MVEGDLLTRCEIFDEADLDAALARFDQLSRPAPQLENAASQVFDRFLAHYQTRDWDVMAEMIRDDFSIDDRRRIVNGGVRHGRDAEIEDLRAAADVGFTNFTSTVIATRGERLFLTLLRASSRDPEAIQADALQVVEIDAEERIAAIVVFDLDDIDAAFEELDARYIAGEAATNAHTWSAVAGAYAALNRHELPATTPDWVNIDHRRFATIEPGEMTASLRAIWDFAPDWNIHIAAVHRLSNHGAVVTQVEHATSQEGFDAEGREIDILTVDDDLISRCEVFDEADIDAALARFEQLSRPTPRLENAASNAGERFLAYFAARDWDAMAEILADDYSSDDRRRVVNAGVRHGRDAEIVNMRAIEDLWITDVTSTVIATRGGRLTLMRACYSGRDQGPEVYLTEILGVIEINADDRISSLVVFDPDDIDAAIEELDARYLAGEAAPYAHIWELTLDTLGELNRHEPGPMVRGSTYADHRRVPFAQGDFGRAIEDLWVLVPDASYRVTAVHALEAHGAVFSLVIDSTDAHGTEMQWARALVMSVTRGEIRQDIYEEDDLDAAIARFEELRARRAAAGKRGKPSVRALVDVLRGPRLGRHCRHRRPRHIRRRSSSRRECRRPTRSGCPDRKHACDR